MLFLFTWLVGKEKIPNKKSMMMPEIMLEHIKWFKNTRTLIWDHGGNFYVCFHDKNNKYITPYRQTLKLRAWSFCAHPCGNTPYTSLASHGVLPRTHSARGKHWSTSALYMEHQWPGHAELDHLVYVTWPQCQGKRDTRQLHEWPNTMVQV